MMPNCYELKNKIIFRLIMFMEIENFLFRNEDVRIARGIARSYRSNRNSPTALGKMANQRNVYFAIFSNGVLPK